MHFPSFDLTGKIAVLVGASRGIGRPMALAMGHAGADVVVSSRTRSELESLADELRGLGRKSLVHTADVTNIKDIQALSDAVVEEFGRIDILVNNAGLGLHEPAFDATEEQWDSLIDTNLKGVFFCCQIIGKVMVKQRKGKIINLNSTFGLVGIPNRSIYCSSKGGITQLTKALAVEWAPYNVNVNAIAPTSVRTPMNEALHRDPKWRKEWLGRLPMDRFCEPEDLFGALVFFASDTSDMVTGVTLPIDGGWTAW